MIKPETAVAMKDFIATKLGYVVWNQRKVEKMAMEQFSENQDLLIHTEDEVFRIGKETIADYFTGASEPLPKVAPKLDLPPAETVIQETPIVVETPEVVVEDTNPVVQVSRRVGRPKKEVSA